jgi:hypothetical protein
VCVILKVAALRVLRRGICLDAARGTQLTCILTPQRSLPWHGVKGL